MAAILATLNLPLLNLQRKVQRTTEDEIIRLTALDPRNSWFSGSKAVNLRLAGAAVGARKA